jgi:phosphopentomutase
MLEVSTIMMNTSPRRAFIMVIDALGVGAMPDAPDYNDSLECNTLGHIDKHCPQLNLPTLERLGLGHIIPLRHVSASAPPLAKVGKLAEHSIGKDTTTGHWEMAGIVLEKPFPTYPNGFPPDVVEAFLSQTGCTAILGNKPASGTRILDELGETHLKTGHPIVYTSADSVWQIAAHVDVIPLPELYRLCEVARELLRGEHEVSRVIARPFEGTKAGEFKRIGHARHDYAVEPPHQGNYLLAVQAAGVETIGIGKIKDIFCGVGIGYSLKSMDNSHGQALMQQLLEGSVPSDVWEEGAAPHPEKPQLIFNNLVETDMNFGHRRDVLGYGKALEAIDERLVDFINAMQPTDLLVITGDHGCDPTAPGSDHTREYTPYIAYSPGVEGGHVGTLQGFKHVGKACLEWLSVPVPA